MENAPSSSQPALLDVTDISPQICFTPFYGGCRICHSFEILRGYYLEETHPWDDIVTSAHTCIYCDAIIRGCRGWLQEDGKCDWTPSTLRLDFTYPSEHGETSTYRWRDSNVVYDWHNQSVFHRLDRLRHATETVSHYCVTMTFLSTTITLVILAAKWQPIPESWNYFQRACRATGFTGSVAAFQTANKWLENCAANHAICGSEKDAIMPTRVLDLCSFDDEDVIRLVEDPGVNGRYAALSHCWGTTVQFTTTKATLLERYDHIPLVELPKTFREAVQVVRKLGLRYLWIDSLCIVQDDHDDWAREASKMSTVYHNAFVTVSATASRSGDEGLFRRYSECEVQIQWKEGDASTLIFCEGRHHLDCLPREFPLSERAWCLQERLLSPRVLHYTYSELAFECLEELQCECGATKDTQWNANIQAPKTYLRTKVSPVERAPIWETIVAEYSSRQMTYPGDKLVAIAGLAKKLAKRDDRYVAGLWKSRLHEQLQWFVSPNSDPRLPKPAWRAPSWSWAAVDNPISYPDISYKFKSFVSLNRPTTSAEIIDCDAVPKTTDEYGELQSGRLRLLGRCTPVVWDWPVWQSDGVENYVIFPSGYKHKFWLDALIVDAHSAGTPVEDFEISCILFSASSSFRTSLVLRRLESGKDVFERIGLLSERIGRKCVTLEDVNDVFPSEKTVVEIV